MWDSIFYLHIISLAVNKKKKEKGKFYYISLTVSFNVFQDDDEICDNLERQILLVKSYIWFSHVFIPKST
jgi:hypothetical protein